MRLVALKALPNGIPAGTTFEENPIVGNLLIDAKAARAVTDADERPRLFKRRRQVESTPASD